MGCSASMPRTSRLPITRGNRAISWPGCGPAARRSRFGWIQSAEPRIRVRIVARRLREPQRRTAERQLRERSRRRGRAPSEQALVRAGWVVLVTNLFDETAWSDADIWHLYAARWQIERLFKRMKQLLGIGTLAVTTIPSAEAVIRLRLIAWVLHEGEAAQLKRLLHAAAAPAPPTLPGQLPTAEAVVSTWLLSTLVLITMRHVIGGTWTFARLRACLPQLQRVLVSHPRWIRVHQATEVWAWRTGVRRTPRRRLLDAEYAES